jgi:prevent-host-death family protein
MKKASVSETKNRLSAILDQVKEGETYLILDRGRPVARLEPVRGGESKDSDEARLADLERRGLVRRGKGKIPREFFETPPQKLPKGFSVLEALLEERREGR